MIFDDNLLFSHSLEEITLISLTLWGPSSDLSGSLSITLSQDCHLKVGHLVVSKMKLSSWWSKIIIMIRLWAECIIVRPCTATIVSLTFAKYSVKLLFPECDPPDERLASSLFSLFSSSSSSSSLAHPHPHHSFHNHDHHCLDFPTMEHFSKVLAFCSNFGSIEMTGFFLSSSFRLVATNVSWT